MIAYANNVRIVSFTKGLSSRVPVGRIIVKSWRPLDYAIPYIEPCLGQKDYRLQPYTRKSVVEIHNREL